MMKNQTLDLDLLQLEGLKVTPETSVPAFVFLLLIYIFIVVANVGLVALISMESSLHQPMYLLFCNMSVNDVFGASTVIPRLLSDIFVSDRYITYTDCVVQTFCSHFHAATSHTVLMIMAYDRYVAVCSPLHYAAIMTGRMVVKLSTAAWSTAFVVILVLVLLDVRLSRCRRVIRNPFCDNASLFKLSCENVVINQVYGIFTAIGMLTVSVSTIMLTYLRIAIVCLSGKSNAVNGRALQTCATHLALYVVLLLSGCTIVALHRFPYLSDQRKLASIMLHVVPPALNAVIYGLQIKAVRQKIFILFTRNKMTVFQVKR
ncbi:olfactory receptor 5F1-like [Salarias fasciatus]|uniref:olfactory receptor 5F1-like n=1 Tax=Salarias fasciatus TaxID=181472 RepID=UPI0011765E3D|nr:olfactory receptor 5F1-like [Salarias fasciatus]